MNYTVLRPNCFLKRTLRAVREYTKRKTNVRQIALEAEIDVKRSRVGRFSNFVEMTKRPAPRAISEEHWQDLGTSLTRE